MTCFNRLRTVYIGYARDTDVNRQPYHPLQLAACSFDNKWTKEIDSDHAKWRQSSLTRSRGRSAIRCDSTGPLSLRHGMQSQIKLQISLFTVHSSTLYNPKVLSDHTEYVYMFGSSLTLSAMVMTYD